MTVSQLVFPVTGVKPLKQSGGRHPQLSRAHGLKLGV